MYTIDLPDLVKTPYVIVPTQLGTETYYFEYFWNTRQELCYLSVYKIENNETIYILKNISLICGMEITKYVDTQLFGGKLLFYNNLNSSSQEYNVLNFQTDFEIEYIEPEE